MKKIFFMMALAIVGLASANAQLKIGVKAGLNASTISGLKETLDDVNNGSVPYKAGFHAGVNARYLFGGLGVETGLFYSQIGGRTKTGNIEYSSNPSYLQLPVQLLYKLDLGLGLAIVPLAGLYAAYGLGGKSGESLLFDKDGVNWNRLDFGLAFGLNVEHSGFTIGLGYDLGLARLNKESMPSGIKDFKNGNIKVSVGYFF